MKCAACRHTHTRALSPVMGLIRPFCRHKGIVVVDAWTPPAHCLPASTVFCVFGAAWR